MVATTSTASQTPRHKPAVSFEQAAKDEATRASLGDLTTDEAAPPKRRGVRKDSKSGQMMMMLHAKASSSVVKKRRKSDAHIVIQDPIIHSIRKSQYYAHDEKIAIVVVCSKYDKTRSREGCGGGQGYQDLSEVLADRDTVLSQLAKLSFSKDEIVVMEDPSYHEMNIYMRELALKIAKATAQNKKQLIFWYYAGHGIQDNTVSMILNQAEGKYSYPIELQLRSLTKCGNAYVIGLFDCCR